MLARLSPTLTVYLELLYTVTSRYGEASLYLDTVYVYSISRPTSINVLCMLFVQPVQDHCGGGARTVLGRTAAIAAAHD